MNVILTILGIWFISNIINILLLKLDYKLYKTKLDRYALIPIFIFGPVALAILFSEVIVKTSYNKLVDWINK